jgi:predicted ATPase
VAWTWTDNLSYRRGDPYRWARLFAQAVADEHGVDSGTMARRLLFTDDLPEEAARRFGGAIATIARDAAFSGWEDEAAHMPSDAAVIVSTLTEVADRYLGRLMATSGPRVVVIDDLHLIDPSSGPLVDLIIGRTTDRPIVALVGLRPGSMPAWFDRPGVETVVIGGLTPPDTARLATIVAGAAVDAAAAHRIHERTAGNPLFVGETVRAFLDDGTLDRRDGRVALSGTGSPALPITLRAVLGARIDALDPEEREVIDVASVVGITFSRRLIDAVLGREVATDVLERIAATAMIVPVGEGRWRFAHALTHDAAYAGLLATRRRALHGRLADHLEETADVGEPGLIATHRVASGDAARAIPLLRVAAESARALGATAEAAGWWQQAAALAAADDPEGARRDRVRAAEALGGDVPESD